MLFDLHANNVVPFEVYDRHFEITSMAAQNATGVFKIDMDQYDIEMQHSRERKGRIQQGQMMTARELRLGADLIRDTEVIAMEYIPYARQIVEAEDIEEMKEQEKRPRMGRMTRNSARNNYMRVLDLTVDGRRGLEESMFIEGARECSVVLTDAYISNIT